MLTSIGKVHKTTTILVCNTESKTDAYGTSAYGTNSHMSNYSMDD
jgi:hypothetical protein